MLITLFNEAESIASYWKLTFHSKLVSTTFDTLSASCQRLSKSNLSSCFLDLSSFS